VAEREWREAIDMRPSKVGLVAVLAAAAILRFWGIWPGVPSALDPGEPEIVERVVGMMKTGDFNPHFFGFPSLWFYVQLVVACANFLVHAATGAWTSLDQATAAGFYVWGRAAAAVLGTITVYVVFQIGLRWGARHALLAAALFAVMPHHVRESHYVLTEAPLAFLMALAFLMTLRALEKGTPRAFAVAGLVAGFAVSTRYYGVVAVLLPLLAAYLNRHADRRRLRCGLAAGGAAVATFLVLTPYALVELPRFLNDLATVLSAGQPAAAGGRGWIAALKFLRDGFGWPGFLLALAGFGLGVVRAYAGPGQARFGLAVMLAIVALLVAAGRGPRELLPVMPVLSVLAAVAVVSGVSLLRRFNIPRWARTSLIAALTVAALLPPVISSIRWLRMTARPAAAAVALAGASARLPETSAVALDTVRRLPTGDR
jgi:4-amino-4-deoxy-L-arabinose transferase-like glycosyltransferase